MIQTQQPQNRAVVTSAHKGSISRMLGGCNAFPARPGQRKTTQGLYNVTFALLELSPVLTVSCIGAWGLYACVYCTKYIAHSYSTKCQYNDIQEKK